jgi:hypothetical protein
LSSRSNYIVFGILFIAESGEPSANLDLRSAVPDNILTSAEIKRQGLAVIEERLARGPVHLMKRNRRAAVVLSEAVRQRLLEGKPRMPTGEGALRWLLTQSSHGQRRCEEIEAGLQKGCDG